MQPLFSWLTVLLPFLLHHETTRNNTRPFGANKKVPKRQRGGNRANQRSQNEGVSACEKGLAGP